MIVVVFVVVFALFLLHKYGNNNNSHFLVEIISFLLLRVMDRVSKWLVIVFK